MAVTDTCHDILPSQSFCHISVSEMVASAIVSLLLVLAAGGSDANLFANSDMEAPFTWNNFMCGGCSGEKSMDAFSGNYSFHARNRFEFHLPFHLVPSFWPLANFLVFYVISAIPFAHCALYDLV